MADNPYKRAIVNRAMVILNAGLTSAAGALFASIDDTEFADFTTVSEATSGDKRLMCFLYEHILKQVLEDIKPDFACQYADLGQVRAVNQEFGGWEYLFELPTDFLCLVKQLAEGDQSKEENKQQGYLCELLHFKSYSHTVVGSDDNVYYCKLNHTSATADKPITGANYATYWTLDSTETLDGAEWAASVAYETNATGPMLATNALTNDAGDSAYIKYVAYVQAGRSDQPQYYPESFKNAFATRLAAEMAEYSKDFNRRQRLLEEYERLAKSAHWHVQNRHKDRVKNPTVFEARTRF